MKTIFGRFWKDESDILIHKGGTQKTPSGSWSSGSSFERDPKESSKETSARAHSKSPFEERVLWPWEVESGI